MQKRQGYVTFVQWLSIIVASDPVFFSCFETKKSWWLHGNLRWFHAKWAMVKFKDFEKLSYLRLCLKHQPSNELGWFITPCTSSSIYTKNQLNQGIYLHLDNLRWGYIITVGFLLQNYLTFLVRGTCDFRARNHNQKLFNSGVATWICWSGHRQLLQISITVMAVMATIHHVSDPIPRTKLLPPDSLLTC